MVLSTHVYSTYINQNQLVKFIQKIISTSKVKFSIFSASTHFQVNYLPVVDKLVNSSVVRTDVRFSELPHPVTSGTNRWCDNTFGSRTWTCLWEAKLNGNGLESAQIRQEKDCACCIRFAAIKCINPIEERKVYIMVIHYEKLICIQSLSHIQEMNIFN